MKILVTGGTGFVGSHIARELLSQGHEVLITGSCPERVPKGTKFLPHNLNGIDFRSLEGIEVVFHQSANNNTMDNDYEQMIRSNFYAACDLFLGILHHSECKQFVYASSTAIYGNQPTPYKENQQPGPLNAYGRSKLRFDDYAIEFGKRHDVNVIGLRYSNVFGAGESHKGPRASMVSRLAEKIRDGSPITLFKNGTQKREWIYVKDVVKANLLAMNFKGIEIFNCGTGKPYTFNEVVNILYRYFDEKKAINTLYHLDKKHLINYIENPRPEEYQNNVHTDMTKAQEILGFSPNYDLIDGITDCF